jgi:hypothetical protein
MMDWEMKKLPLQKTQQTTTGNQHLFIIEGGGLGCPLLFLFYPMEKPLFHTIKGEPVHKGTRIYYFNKTTESGEYCKAEDIETGYEKEDDDFSPAFLTQAEVDQWVRIYRMKEATFSYADMEKAYLAGRDSYEKSRTSKFEAFLQEYLTQKKK